jgi:hypothetical protein
MLLLIDIFSINKRRRYEKPSLEIIVTERCLTGGCPLEEACEHCYLESKCYFCCYFVYHLCLPLEATIKIAGSLQWSRHNGVARCTTTILIILISDAPSKSIDRCHSIPGKIFNFIPSNGTRNVSVRSHPWIACRSRA